MSFEEFEAALADEFPHLELRPATSEFATAYLVQDAFDLTLPSAPSSLAIGSAPSRHDLIRLVRLFRRLVPEEVPLLSASTKGTAVPRPCR